MNIRKTAKRMDYTLHMKENERSSFFAKPLFMQIYCIDFNPVLNAQHHICCR